MTSVLCEGGHAVSWVCLSVCVSVCVFVCRKVHDFCTL